MITRTFKLCLNAGTGSAPYINVNQYDEGETWLFELYTEQGERYLPTTGAIVGIKSDDHGIANTGTVDSNGRVVIKETEQMTAAAGRAIFELSIDGLTHGTANFIVMVERKPTEDAVMSDSDYSMFQEVIDAAEVIEDVIGDGDPSEVIGEHVDAWLDAHPEATTTVQDGAITAPKLNSTLWDKLLVSESASGAVASFDDGADDVPVSSLKVALEPIQTGTGDPSPSNVRPIVASNGKNLLQVTGTTQTINGVTFTVNADGTVRATGTVTSNRATFSLGSVNFKANTGYILNGTPSGGSNSTYNMNIAGAFSVDTGNGGAVYTPTADVTYAARIDIYQAAGNVDLLFKPMIRLASITDSSYQPYQGIMVERCGKNLLQNTATSKTENGITFTVNADGTVTANGTSTALVNLTVGRVYVKAGETYILKATSGGSASTYKMRAVVRNANGGAIDIGGGPFQDAYGGIDKLITMPSNASYMDVYCNVENGKTVTNALYEPMVRLASATDATYEPYQSASYPYSLGQSVYGGTVDLATGVLTVDRVGVSLNDPTKWVNSTYTTVDFEYTVNFSDRKKTNDSYAELMCSYVPANNMQANYCRWYSASGNKFGIKTDGTLTLEQIKSDASEGNIFISYPLATPTTVQLTPQEVKTLLGYNNISSSGTVEVIYHADTKLYVDKMTAVDNNIIAPTEETFTATRNYTVNDLVIVADTLYKVTANIQNGGTITPNSNVTQTTLSALIKALS